MQSASGRVVILGTGGTIAGTAASAQDQVGYTAATLSVAELLAAVPPLAGLPIEVEQVAQVDSKDMTHGIWCALAERVAGHLARTEVDGLVVTHGTDTLEETAYFLQRLLAPAKPVVLTAAMRPATSLQADGPQNLLDAVTVAREPGAAGVLAVLAGEVFDGADLRKRHTYCLNAFEPGERGLVARVVAGQVQALRPWPTGQALGIGCIEAPGTAWPRVEIVLNHADADGRIVDLLVAQGIDGLVLAGTGNGSLSERLEAAARRAQATGVRVLRVSRCAAGPVTDAPQALPAADGLSAAQARVELVLRCLVARQV